MSPPTETWWSLLTALRDAVGAYYDAAGVPFPDRRAVAPGPLPAWDCEQFTVALIQSYNHTGNLAAQIIEQTRSSAGFAMRAIVVDLSVVRCLKGVLHDFGHGDVMPTVEEIEADAYAIAIDEEMLRAAVLDAVDTGIVPGCNRVAFELWDALEPSGALGGGSLRLRLSP